MARTSATPVLTNADDEGYDAFMHRMQARFLANVSGQALFTTNADGEHEVELDTRLDRKKSVVGDSKLFAAYIDTFPASKRKYHTCRTCRHFVERFGGLVTIDEKGVTRSAIWTEEDAPPHYAPGVAAMRALVEKAAVTGVFYSSDDTWGVFETNNKEVWNHFAVTPPASLRHSSRTKTAFQMSAEKKENRGSLARGLAEFTEEHIATALTLLRADALYRAEKVLGVAEWLANLQAQLKATRNKRLKDNILWRAVALAPPGFCHPRSSMVGTLLADIADGKPFEAVRAAFSAKMNPLQYQRPQAPPSVGNIAQAEKLVEKLGIAGSLRRRYALVEELEALWRPAPMHPVVAKGGVFGHLQNTKSVNKRLEAQVPAQTMTWDKFARTVLPTAEQVELLVPAHGNFTAYLTEAIAGARPILQWDNLEQRNPLSSYVWSGGSAARQWGLTAGVWAAVNAVSSSPAHWHGGEDRFKHVAKTVVFVLDGAKDSGWERAGLGLFPEALKTELREVRATIEAHSARSKLESWDQATACGLAAGGAGSWSINVRVTSRGTALTYRLDRMD